MTSISVSINFIQIIFHLNYFLGSPKGCDTLKNKKGIRVEGCGRKTTTALPFKQKWPKIKRPNIPRVHQTEDDNNTDSNSTTTVTPDGNIAQQDSVVVLLSIGNCYVFFLGFCSPIWYRLYFKLSRLDGH